MSYHHGGDQPYYDAFSRTFADAYDVIYDNSLERKIDSDNVNYVMQRIREDYISGSSCTIVLCGPETRWRKYVDWETKATLDKEHGLVGIRLPTTPLDGCGRWHKPDRFQDNLNSGYAIWTTWESLVQGGASVLRQLVEAANGKPKDLIVNNRPMMTRDGTPPWKTFRS